MKLLLALSLVALCSVVASAQEPVTLDPLAPKAKPGSTRVRVTKDAPVAPQRALPQGRVRNTDLNNPFAGIIAGNVRPFQLELDEEAEDAGTFRQVPKGNLVQSNTSRQTFFVTDSGVHRAKVQKFKPEEVEPDTGDIEEFADESNASVRVPWQYQGNGVWASLPTREQYDATLAGRDPFEQVQQETAQRRSDPLILDLEGRGIHLIGPRFGVRFDVNADNIAEYTGWVGGANEGILCWDRNNDGRINNGTELFGMTQNSPDPNGFAVLKRIDSDNNDVFDNKDSNYPNVRVWRDVNRNAVAERDELFDLAKLGIESINIKFDESDFYVDSHKNKFREHSTFTRVMKNGQKVELPVVNIWFANHVIR